MVESTTYVTHNSWSERPNYETQDIIGRNDQIRTRCPHLRRTGSQLGSLVSLTSFDQRTREVRAPPHVEKFDPGESNNLRNLTLNFRYSPRSCTAKLEEAPVNGVRTLSLTRVRYSGTVRRGIRCQGCQRPVFSRSRLTGPRLAIGLVPWAGSVPFTIKTTFPVTLVSTISCKKWYFDRAVH